MKLLTMATAVLLVAAAVARAEQVSVDGGPLRDVKSGDVIPGRHRAWTESESEGLRLLKLAVEAQCKAQPENCKPWVEPPLPCAPRTVGFQGNEAGTAATDPETCDMTVTVGEPDPSEAAGAYSAQDDD
jgi:hypothetical protein